MDILKFLDKVKEREIKNITYGLENSKREIEFYTKKIGRDEERKKDLESKTYEGMETKIKAISEKAEELGFIFDESHSGIYRCSDGYFKDIKGKYKTLQHEVPVEGRIAFCPEDSSISIELNRSVKNTWGTTYAGPRMIRISSGKIMRVTNNILVALMHREER